MSALLSHYYSLTCDTGLSDYISAVAVELGRRPRGVRLVTLG
jgi:hypothetical protein